MPQKLSIVVPVYNEEETLSYTHNRLKGILSLPEFQDLGFFELIYVNDGSRDRSAHILKKLIQENDLSKLQIKVIHFARNFGHSNAVLAGLEASTGDYIAIVDADLQDPPELLAPMYAEIRSGNDVVYGQRVSREAETIFKKISAWGFYRLLNSIAGVEIPRDTGDFRIMTREVCNALLSCKEHDPFLRGLVAWLGFEQKAFPYKRESRKYGTTKYPLKKMLRFAGAAIMGFSNLPLKIAIYLGFIAFLSSVGILTWALVVHSLGKTVPGWTSLLVAFLFGQSITLLVIGTIGLYIGQIHVGIQGRPRYIVKSRDS